MKKILFILIVIIVIIVMIIIIVNKYNKGDIKVNTNYPPEEKTLEEQLEDQEKGMSNLEREMNYEHENIPIEY